MQFREQANKIQVLRSVYDPASKRCRQMLAFSFSRYGDPTAEQLEKLTDAEQQEFAAFMANRQREKDSQMQAFYAAHGTQHLTQLISAVPLMTDEQAGQIWEKLAALQKALRKAGHKRPEKQKAVQDTDEGQANLPV